MNKIHIFVISLCVVLLSVGLYVYVEKQNVLTQLKMELPSLVEEIADIQEENSRYRYEIDQFENPMHLMELMRSPEFAHLKHPILEEIATVEEGVALQEEQSKAPKERSIYSP
ncbi:MAG: hypothetical protein JW769_04190 [Parachlamydiales bacterium]|nr:hypothetical protein [Parachlamydiales bacterium]